MSKDTAAPKADGFTRPEVPHPAEPGTHWEAAEKSRDWAPAEPGKKCRFRGSSARACGDDASVVLMRGITRRIPWNYCASDALARYGVWLEDGKVMTWKLREDAPGE